MRASLRSRIIRRVISGPSPLARLRSRLPGTGDPALTLFYEVGDPWSHLCARWLARHKNVLSCPLRIQMVTQADATLFPEPERQRQYAIADARQMAPGWDIPLPTTLHWPDADQRRRVEQALTATDNLEAWLAREEALVPALIGNDFPSLNQALSTVPRATEEATALALTRGNSLRQRLGHYLPGMWHYRGDWFWGLDRLPHLFTDLRQQGALAKDAQPQESITPSKLPLPGIDGKATLEFFYSFRSPYSYLAALKLRESLDSWPVRLVIRPVLPMVMRGFQVPRIKRLYIARDAYREAARQRLEFGLVADPLGPGILQGLQLFEHFDDSRRQLDFLCHYGAASWARGLDVRNPAVAKHAVEQAGGNWAEAKNLLKPGVEPGWVANNRQALLDRGLWGVPSFTVGDWQIWGQDRMALLEEAFARSRVAQA